MTDQDFTANSLSIGGIILTLAEIQTALTIIVLATALVLNVVRIVDIRRKANQDKINEQEEVDKCE
jgi:hypothetical protein